MNESIDDLRLRWEEEPSPQLALQLAEEYRRQDRLQEAVEVLSQGLEEHPDHMAARVALGRYRFEMGDLPQARELLEQVAQEDPTHLVASKLLVSLYLEAGEKSQARDRLDLYKLLNEHDPDIETLEDRLEGRQAMPPRVDSGPRVVSVVVPRNGDPFRDLWSGVDPEAAWQAVGTEGVFPVFRAVAVAAEVRAEAPVEVATEPEEVEESEIPGATVTLANLYLQQGHLDDAESAFREVLDRDPSNGEAHSGLETVDRLRSESLVGEEDSTGSLSEELEGDPTGRKIEALNEYLRRIRAADNRQ